MHQAPRHVTLQVLLALALPVMAMGQQRPLTLDDYGEWNRITEVGLSADGRWLAYTYQPNDGDGTLFVEGLEDGTLYEGPNGGAAEFSEDGRWVAFLSSPPEEEAKALRKDKKPVPQTLHLIDLGTGDRTEEEGAQSFSFSTGGRFLAIQRDRTDAEADHTGADLLLKDLQQGTLLSFGNVSEFAFDEAGERLAYLVDAAGKAGNGLYVVNAADGRIQPLSTGPDRFEDVTWSEAGTDVAALRGEKNENDVHRTNSLVVATGLDSSPQVTVYDPGSDDAFPAGLVLSELADTEWTEDGARVVVGLKEQAAEESGDEDDEDDEPNVDVWHWADDRLQSVQMVQADRDRDDTYESVYNVETGRLVQLANSDMRDVSISGRGVWATGRHPRAYRDDLDTEGGRFDYLRVNMNTGEESPIAQGLRRPLGTSPDGRWFVYVQDEAVYSADLQTLAITNLTESTGIDFINREFDRVAEEPTYPPGGWTEDGRILLNTKWDVWAVPLAGGEAQSLTAGVGERDQIRFRPERLDPDADWVDPDELILSAYGEWTKKSGYFRARPGGEPEPLLFGDEMIRDLRRASDSDRIVFTRQTFERFPDYWSSDVRFRNPEQVTDANPQIGDFAWGRRVLVDYVDERGNELQATLALPAGYEEGQQYPMVVYFYEKMSQRHHEFSRPTYDDRPHMSTYASNGYLVLMPDIVYDDGYPGSSALDDVVAASKKVIELGYADPDRIGLQGHSWGGYETSFILTQTDMFATIVTGAPLTNLMSMNNILYKRSGNQNGPILQWSQGRMGDQPWDDFERWVSQSPVHQAPNISTPFLILHGTEDGAVDWNQGLELYTAARRLDKEVILLSYPDEPHHLAKKANQKDFQIRMKQYFDHYLKGTEAPEWMLNGVPFLEKGKKAAGRKTVS